ncbi:rod-binding protein [Jiella sonneratiae]|uniref:Rod-binding protein n=1 Tax=Jiella sonneratiae TaxID=2816856 RepID=A0ABS3J1R1_9HYPH|nr:rod-binding protein [Jiella sonneratiae]MBO0903594.1 rod-binding protein [Jiella sonneratiae]
MTVSNDFTINPAIALQRAAQRESVAQPAAAGAAGTDFTAALRTAAAATAATPVAKPLQEPTIRPLVKHEARKVGPLEQFEGFVLRSFIQSMLPSEDSGFFGEGTAGSVWRSMLAEQIGDEIAKGGGIGIAAEIAKRDKLAAPGRAAAADASAGVDAMETEDGAMAAAAARRTRTGG